EARLDEWRLPSLAGPLGRAWRAGLGLRRHLRGRLRHTRFLWKKGRLPAVLGTSSASSGEHAGNEGGAVVADRPIKQLTRKQFLPRAGGPAALPAIGTPAAAAGASAASGPAAPAGLTALSLDTRVVLAWKPVSGATYNVYRGATATTVTTKIASAVAGTTFA